MLTRALEGKPVQTTGARVCCIYFDFRQSAIAGERGPQIYFIGVRTSSRRASAYLSENRISLFGDIPEDGQVEAETCRSTS